MKKQEINRLWVLVNKLRGAFDATELYKIMLYALLFKYLELKKDEIDFYDEKFSLGYLSLTYGKIIYSGNLVGYLTEVENFYNIEYGVLCETIDPILYKADEDSVRHIFESIDCIEINEQKDLYELSKLIVERMSLQIRRELSYHYTSESLAKLEKGILDVQKGMKVYDGYCGSGLSVNEVAAGKGTVYLQDLSVQAIGVATILTLLSDNKIGTIKCGDSILNPIPTESGYDRIVIESPLKISYESAYLRFLEEGNVLYSNFIESETIGIRHAIAQLKLDGMAVAFVPMGILFKAGKTKKIRELLVEDRYIDSVVELPNGIIHYTMATTALLILKRNRLKDDNSVFMINARSFFENTKRGCSISDEKISKLTEIIKNKKIIKDISKKVDANIIKKNEYNLCPQQYVMENPEENIVIGDTEKLIKTYKNLKKEFNILEDKLEKIRAKFI